MKYLILLSLLLLNGCGNKTIIKDKKIWQCTPAFEDAFICESDGEKKMVHGLTSVFKTSGPIFRTQFEVRDEIVRDIK